MDTRKFTAITVGVTLTLSDAARVTLTALLLHRVRAASPELFDGRLAAAAVRRALEQEQS